MKRVDLLDGLLRRLVRVVVGYGTGLAASRRGVPWEVGKGGLSEGPAKVRRCGGFDVGSIGCSLTISLLEPSAEEDGDESSNYDETWRERKREREGREPGQRTTSSSKRRDESLDSPQSPMKIQFSIIAFCRLSTYAAINLCTTPTSSGSSDPPPTAAVAMGETRPCIELFETAKMFGSTVGSVN